MAEFLSEYYLLIKAIHIIAVISWMAGLLYLPRLFVYHTQVDVGGEQDKLFQTMEHKLIRIIINPAMITTWVLGLMLAFTPSIIGDGAYWWHAKFLLVVLLSVFHMKLAGWRKKFASGNNEKSEGFFRKANEVPTILMIAIVIIVMVKPF